MTLEQAEKNVAKLADKAAEQQHGDEALRYSQAACNVANAFNALTSAKNQTLTG